MGVPHYLAMTAAELAVNPPSDHTAWLACHFSPYSEGLSNLPSKLPAHSLLVLDDSTPMENHDPQTILRQLEERTGALQCWGLLLDFQRPEVPQEQAIARYLADSLPCFVGVSHLYARELACPVLLPPVPPYCGLNSYFEPWKGRELWLETSLGGNALTLTEDGCSISPFSGIPEAGFPEEELHCHYRIETGDDFARFTLWRTREDLERLLTQAEALGVTMAVGLFQELHL